MPDQVEKLAEEADTLHRKLYPEQYTDQPPANQPADQPPVTPDQPPVTPPVNQLPVNQPADQPPVNQEVKVAIPAVTPAIPADQPPITDDVQALKKDLETQIQRFKVLQGKYDAEVPRMKADNDRLQGLLSEAIVTINRTKTSDAGQPPQTPSRTTPFAGDIPQIKLEDIASDSLKDVKENYPDIYDSLGAIFGKVNEYIGGLSQAVKNVQAEAVTSKGQIFEDNLTKLCPDWETIRDNPGFAEWLQGIEPYSGARLIDLAMAAQQRLDAGKLAKFYLDYKKIKEAKNSPGNEGNGGTPSSSTPPINPDSDNLPPNLAPPRGGAGQGAPPVDTASGAHQPITQSFIQQFYNDAVRGVYSGRDKEYADIEARINQAVRDHKVVNG